MSTLSGVEVRSHPTKGRALYATQSYAAGALILTVTPLILLPLRNNLERVCSHCLTPGEVRGCSRCHQAFYCNAACQAAGWKAVHSKECKPLKNLGEGKHLPSPARAVMQALLVKRIGDGFQDLEGNLQQWRAKPDWNDFAMLAFSAVNFAEIPATELNTRRAVDFLCKIQTNSFQKDDEDLGQIGFFLEPTLAMINHSCIPNAFVHLSRRKAVLRAEAPIKPGDEIQIAYSENTHPLSLRRKALKSYHFICECPRCKDDLNVYQVCAISPNVDLNWRGLVSDLSKLRDHPAATDKKRQALARRRGEACADLSDYPVIPRDPDANHEFLRVGFQRCMPLAVVDLWAVSPMPQLLNEATIYYNATKNYACGLFVACFISTACDPYRFPAPFVSSRSARLFEIVKGLLNIASDVELLQRSIKALSSGGNYTAETRDHLGNIDIVSLAHMLLIMLLGSYQDGCALEEQHSEAARQILSDMEQSPGREQEKSLINMWKQDPKSEQARAFFEFAVVQKVEALARLGRGVIKQDFQV